MEDRTSKAEEEDEEEDSGPITQVHSKIVLLIVDPLTPTAREDFVINSSRWILSKGKNYAPSSSYSTFAV